MSYAKKLMSVRVVLSVLLAGGVLLSGEPGWSAQAQAAKAAPTLEAPITEKELINLVKHNKKHLPTLGPTIEARGVDFELTPDIEKSLRKAGADDTFVAALKNFTPSARAAQAGGSHPPFTKEESDAYNQIKGGQDPDKIIQDSTAYAQKYPKSPLLTYVYGMEAAAYQQKNDADNVVKYGLKSLELDSNNLMSLLLVSSIFPQPQMMNVPDAMKENRLKLAETYASKALQQIVKLPKLPNETDQAYQQRLGQVEGGAYASLGMVHLERSRMALQPPDLEELGKAEQNYKTAIAKSKDPNPTDYYRLGEIYVSEGKLDDAMAAFSNAGKLAPGTIIQQLADRQIKDLKQKQSQAKAPAKP
jgi:tetratricopeptide (TPR) repeat protein